MPVPKQASVAWCYLRKRLTGKIYLGSNVIVAGTAIFGASEPEQVIANLKSAVDAAQAKASAKH